MKKIIKFKVIGLGGIGSYLVEPLCRYINEAESDVELTLIDGDIYKEKNKSRQKFTRLQNKAEESCRLLKEIFSNIHIKFKPHYINDSNVFSTIREDDNIFLCVDNHATRKIVSDRCQDLKNVVLISGGNDLIDGNVICYIKKDGENITKPPTELYSSIANPIDKIPSCEEREGCEERIESEPQLLFTNLAIASMMLNCYRKIEQNKITFNQVYVDIDTLCTRPA